MSFFFEWLVCKCTGSREVLHHLYDFELGNKTADECRMIVDTFIQICKELGVPIPWEKSEGPQQVITFFGLEADSEKMQDRLPEEKVKEIRVTMAYCENRKTT